MAKIGKCVLLCALQGDPDAKIQKPTAAEVLVCKAAVSTKQLHVPDVWAACHGLELGMQAAMDDVTQDMFCNGWTHSHCTSWIFVFTPDEKICICCFNSPGRMLARL
jgi:hypothetical protein